VAIGLNGGPVESMVGSNDDHAPIYIDGVLHLVLGPDDFGDLSPLRAIGERVIHFGGGGVHIKVVGGSAHIV